MANDDIKVEVSSGTSTSGSPKTPASKTKLVLTDELQEVRDSLSEPCRTYYDNINDNEDKVAYLNSIKSDRLKHRNKGTSVIKLFANLIVFGGVIGAFIDSIDSEDDVSKLISNCTVYFIQYVSTIMDLYWVIGFNKKFVLCALYSTVPSGVGLIIAVLLIIIGKYDKVSCLNFIGIGVVFSTWYAGIQTPKMVGL